MVCLTLALSLCSVYLASLCSRASSTEAGRGGSTGAGAVSALPPASSAALGASVPVGNHSQYSMNHFKHFASLCISNS